MVTWQRTRAALVAGAVHLLFSAVVAALSAWLVFRVLYPAPLDRLVGGREIFYILITVDLICGPLLTTVVFDRRKGARKLALDLGVIVLMQCAALAYGLYTVVQARPIFMAFEGDRFRVVRLADIDPAEMDKAPPQFRHPDLSGPKLLGVRLAKSTDKDFPESIRLSLEGLHPAFRPERWLEFDTQRTEVGAAARPLSVLAAHYASEAGMIEAAVSRVGLPKEQLGFLPLIGPASDQWVAVVSLHDGEPRTYLPLDGFFK